MNHLTSTVEQDAIHWFQATASVATRALCLKKKCGTVIVSNSEIIGEGYNAPPLDDISHRRCLEPYNGTGKPKFDHTCCMHAEWRAILDAMKRNPDKLHGSQLFFTRVDDKGNIIKSGQPLCTVCSRFALDVGIAEFVLWHEEGIVAYPTDEYNRLSYEYVHPKTSNESLN